MLECGSGEVRDLLPDLAADRLGGADRARVAAHVATCSACAAEVEMLRTVRRVASRDVPAIDVARIVAALPRPSMAADPKPMLVSSTPRPAVGARRAVSARADYVADRGARRAPARRTLGDWGGWRIAAAATIAVGSLSVAVLRTHGRATPAAVVTTPVTLPGLAVVPATPARPAPTSLAPVGPDDRVPAAESGSGLTVAGDISELSDGDVETLLQDMSGLDAEPAVDPDAAAPGMPGVVSP